MTAEIRTKANVHIALPLVAILLFTSRGYVQKVHLTELKRGYPILKPEDVANVPVIVEGLVIAPGVPVAPVQKSTLDGNFIQLWRGRIQIENVLQGDIERRATDVFYFLGPIPGSARSIYFRPGERHIFFLRRDGANLRTSNDRSRNASLLRVLTGSHPNYNRVPNFSINQAIVSLLLTRGTGIDDRQMIEAIGNRPHYPFIADDQAVTIVQRVAQQETPIVREAACLDLLALRHRCGDEEETVAVKVENLDRPNTNSAFRLGDRIRTTVVGTPSQPVYRSGIGRVGTTDANGQFTRTEVVRLRHGQARTAVWIVGAEQVSPALTYVAGRQGSEGKVVSTSIGNPRDRYGMGISAVSVIGATILGYSATLLDYRTALYYDAEERTHSMKKVNPFGMGEFPAHHLQCEFGRPRY